MNYERSDRESQAIPYPTCGERWAPEDDMHFLDLPNNLTNATVAPNERAL